MPNWEFVSDEDKIKRLSDALMVAVNYLLTMQNAADIHPKRIVTISSHGLEQIGNKIEQALNGEA